MRIFLMTPVGVVVTTHGRKRVKEDHYSQLKEIKELLRTLWAPPKKKKCPFTFSGYPTTLKHCPFLHKQVPNFRVKKIKEKKITVTDLQGTQLPPKQVLNFKL